MINKKKLHFYQLSFIFTSIVVISLLYNWGYIGNAKKSESMMTQSMGNMMSSMHLKNIELSDLFKVESKNINSNSANNSTSHHEGNSSYKKDIYYITTIVIIVLTPFIVSGAIFLTIVWIK